MTDTPIPDPPTKGERIKAAVGDLARPFAIYVISAGAAAGVVIVALKVENGNDGAIFYGAVGVLVGLVIGARAVENINTTRQAAKVEIAKATGQEPSK